MRVLVVEDHSRLAEAMAGGLHEERMAVDVAHDGQDALHRAALTRYHVSVLDQELPSVHGDQICADLAGHRCPRPIALPQPRGTAPWPATLQSPTSSLTRYALQPPPHSAD